MHIYKCSIVLTALVVMKVLKDIPLFDVKMFPISLDVPHISLGGHFVSLLLMKQTCKMKQNTCTLLDSGYVHIYLENNVAFSHSSLLCFFSQT